MWLYANALLNSCGCRAHVGTILFMIDAPHQPEKMTRHPQERRANHALAQMAKLRKGQRAHQGCEGTFARHEAAISAAVSAAQHLLHHIQRQRQAQRVLHGLEHVTHPRHLRRLHLCSISDAVRQKAHFLAAQRVPDLNAAQTCLTCRHLEHLLSAFALQSSYAWRHARQTKD